MKRLIVCFDGTWQRLDQPNPTNVAIIASSIAHAERREGQPDTHQFVIYNKGVGSSVNALGKRSLIGWFNNLFNRMAGGVFGEGLEDELLETYQRLCFNYESGDEIYIFGFSRGAYSARSLTGLINCSGILSRRFVDKAGDAFLLYRSQPKEDASDEKKREHEENKRRFRRAFGKGQRDAQGIRQESDEVQKIKYLGIFETVGQRGAPDAFGWIAKLLNRRYGFHNLKICANVLSARHAVGIDENRLGFPATLWEKLDESNKEAGRLAYEQRWFIGTHGDVGGGEASTLSAAPLKWVVDGSKREGLVFYGTAESPLLHAVKDEANCFESKISFPGFANSMFPLNWPVRPRKIWTSSAKPTPEIAASLIDASAIKRTEATNVSPRYHPPSLRPFRKALSKEFRGK